MRNIVNIGIVGAGFGASFYFHLHPACRVEAVSACFEEERHYLGNTYKCRKQYASLEELLKDPAIDAVALFTPAPLHAEHTIAALNAGKHVLCAVPLGMSIEECQMVKQTAERGADDGGFITAATVAEQYDQPEWWQTALLPEPLRIDSGHGGSHTFLTHEFIDAIVNNRKPRIGIEEAMAYTLPGILAHASAMRNGETLKIPAYGML
ncbi:Gfo/Idh/MocA family protein [Niabella aurantiaca]|uniref:Gfo/Idh/MocA family protein n=1 Tax=Niabella aurantiaca TaxID=379900 RepID=UPI00036FBECC|nr:Gfo/Idh/MocA family oxidoreductase [Niabella aurantiaca]